MALRAKDLMIGDWVYIKDHPIKSLPKKVKSEHFVRSLVEFEPIPLTAEILEKNGFASVGQEVYHWKDANYYVWYETDKHTLGIDQNDSTYFAENISPVLRLTVINLHELQHALKLCGIKKAIEL